MDWLNDRIDAAFCWLLDLWFGGDDSIDPKGRSPP